MQCNVNNEIIIHTRLADYFMRAHKLLPRLLFVLALRGNYYSAAPLHTHCAENALLDHFVHIK